MGEREFYGLCGFVIVLSHNFCIFLFLCSINYPYVCRENNRHNEENRHLYALSAAVTACRLSPQPETAAAHAAGRGDDAGRIPTVRWRYSHR
jgi:hypothetical protein